MADHLIHDFLTETVDWGTEVEQSSDGIVRDVLLCGPKSKNGRLYTERSFGGIDGVKVLYEGVLVFMNHNPKDKHPLDRPIQEAAGVVQNVRWTSAGPRGDINTEGFMYGPLLRGLSKTKAKGVGMSHVIEGVVDPKTGEAKVNKVYSVDAVVNPATTKTFTESTIMDLSEQLTKELGEIRSEKDAAKAEVISLQAQLTEAKDNVTKLLSEGSEAAGQIKTLSEKLAVYEKAEAAQKLKEAVVAELHAEGLKEPVSGSKDPVCISETTMQILLGLSDESQRKALIAERASFLKLAPGAGALPRENGGNEPQKFNALDYVKKFAN